MAYVHVYSLERLGSKVKLAMLEGHKTCSCKKRTSVEGQEHFLTHGSTYTANDYKFRKIQLVDMQHI